MMENREKDLQIKQRDNDDEYLYRKAAAQIAQNEIKEYNLAQQKYQEISNMEEYKSAYATIEAQLDKAESRFRRRRMFSRLRKNLSYTAAGFVLVTTISYFTVDAAKVAINNFFLELQDGYAIVHGETSNSFAQVPLPDGWDGPMIPGWIPDRFVNVSGTAMRYNADLIYSEESSDEAVVISLWSAEASPSIDTEDMVTIRSLEVQGVPATLLLKADNNSLFLTFVKDDSVIQICGDLDESEIVKIAENIEIKK